MSYDYPEKEKWYQIPEPKKPVYPDYMERLIDSPLGEWLLECRRNYTMYGDVGEMAPEVVEYWERMGFRKEMHDADKFKRKWAAYVPLSAYCPGNEDKKYPLIFVFHGGNNSLFETESQGYIHGMLHQEAIIVLPEYNEFTYTDFERELAPEAAPYQRKAEELWFLSLYEKVLDTYSIDETRIYCAGFSIGGLFSSIISMKYPELFAASSGWGRLIPAPELVSDACVNKVKNLRLPMIVSCGRYELRPLCSEPVERDLAAMLREVPDMPPPQQKTPQENLELFNRRQDALHCKTFTLDECRAAQESTNDVRRLYGVPFDETVTMDLYGTRHFIGSFCDDRGKDWLKLFCVDNTPHLPMPTMMLLIWRFFCRFRRNPVTKVIEDSGE